MSNNDSELSVRGALPAPLGKGGAQRDDTARGDGGS